MDIIKNKIEEIYNQIKAAPPKKAADLSLYGGLTGDCLFDLYYHKDMDSDDEYPSHKIESLFEATLSTVGYTLCSGKSGINWLYTHLWQSGLIEHSEMNLLCHDDNLIRELSIYDIKRGNYDLLHGSLGAAYYLLGKREGSDAYFQSILDNLGKSMDNDWGMVNSWNSSSQAVVDDEINMGLAHGILCILKFCIQCFNQNINKEECSIIAGKIVDFLLSNANVNTDISTFPYSVKRHKTERQTSRLGWCYGDLSIGLILYQTGKALGRTEVIDFALELLKGSTKRRTVAETIIYDAGICHGSAGVAHIYNKMWHYTQDFIFKEATDFWIQKTLDFAVHDDGVAGYKRYNAANNSLEPETGFLDGAAGIGLVLLSYLTGNFNWDYCLMLND